MKTVKLLGRIKLEGKIEALTGLHIGGTPGALAIGGVDMPILRDARTNRPYIPGSSLKGKLRSLAEKWDGAPQNTTIHPGKKDGSGKVSIHTAQDLAEYRKYWVNPVFGVTGDRGDWVPAPNRLVVRDVPLSEASARELLEARTDMPFSEVKWEAAIDRVTAAATPRQVERVPAGAVFAPCQMIFSLYEDPGDLELFARLLTALEILEEDYLGGLGSRGSGRIAFKGLTVSLRRRAGYQLCQDARFADLDLGGLLVKQAALHDWLRQALAG